MRKKKRAAFRDARPWRHFGIFACFFFERTHTWLWTETLRVLSGVKGATEVAGEVRRTNQCFYNQDPKMEASGSGNPRGSLLRELKTNWLSEPENNLRTRYIQNRPARPDPTLRRGRVSVQ